MPTRTRPAETATEGAPAEPVTLAELCAEGFGYDIPSYVRSPRDAVDVLAAELGAAVVLDDLGRRVVSRETARRLFAERDEGERRQREAQERYQAEQAEQAARNPVWTGIPAGQFPDGVSAATAMLQAAKDAQPRRQSVLDHALQDRDGQIEYHPIQQEPR
jgi:hypothetical protein